MRKLRLSTTTNLVPRVEDKIYEHTMANAEMAKRVGFDALDFSFCPNVFDEDRFEEYAEWGLEASERFGLKYEVCHLPFSGKVALDPSLLPALETKIFKAIKGARVLGVKYAVVHPNTTTLLRREYDEEKIYESVIAHLAPIVECGEREGNFYFDIMGGTIMCYECNERRAKARLPIGDPHESHIVSVLSETAKVALGYCVHAPLEKLFSFNIPDEDMALFAKAAELYFTNQMERTYKTLEFYNSVKRN